MPHIAEGDLHAWLDGGLAEDSPEDRRLRIHVEVCADCRARLEEARRLRFAAAKILADAVPATGDMPRFEELQRKAGGEAPGSSVAHALRHRLGRGGWRSIERLAWAASVVLAVGAGWMGREILVERGWTDPFHQDGGGTASGDDVSEPSFGAAAADAPTEEEVPLVPAAERRDETEAQRDRVSQTPSSPGRGDEALPSEAEGEALSVAEKKAGPTAAVGELSEADASPRVRETPEPLALQPPMDGWHLPPDPSGGERETGTGSCYRLSADWFTGGDLPKRVRLTRERDSGFDVAVYRVSVLDGGTEDVRQALWTTFATDSAWIRIVTLPESEILTARMRRAGDGYRGEGRALSVAAPVQPGSRHGPVYLVEIACPKP
jgi:hypothetical protein